MDFAKCGDVSIYIMLALKMVLFHGAVVRRLRCSQFRLGTFHAIVGLGEFLLTSPILRGPNRVFRLHNGTGQLVRTGVGATTS